MGVSNSLRELREKVHEAGQFDKHVAAAMEAIEEYAVETVVPRALRRAGVRGGSMTNLTKVPMTVKVKINPTKDAIVISPLPAGPWAILEKGAKEHRIDPRRKQRDMQALSLPDGTYAHHVQHPGVKGKRTWSLVKREVEDKAVELLDKEVQKSLKEVFG